jgi:hypothetical protein
MVICHGAGIWTILPYITAAGNCPVREFLEDFLRSADYRQYRFLHDVLQPLLREQGPALGLPYWQSLGRDLGEMKWSRYRIYCYVLSGNRQLIMLEGVTKKWPRFRPRDRDLCSVRAADLLSPHYNYGARHALLRDKLKTPPST